MSPVVRLLVTAVVRLGLLFYAGWFAFAEAPLGDAGIPMVSRVGLVLLCLVLQVILGELGQLRTHFGLLVGGLRAAGRQDAVAGLSEAAEAAAIPMEGNADPKASVDILVQALATKDPDTVEKVHKHLVRLTGKKLPPEVALWQRWWQENRENWAGPPTGAPGNDGCERDRRRRLEAQSPVHVRLRLPRTAPHPGRHPGGAPAARRGPRAGRRGVPRDPRRRGR